MGVGIRLQDISRVYHMLRDTLVDVGSRLQTLFCIYHRLLDNIFLPWTLEDQVDDVTKEQSEQSDLRRHAEDADQKSDVEAQCWNKSDKRCY